MKTEGYHQAFRNMFLLCAALVLVGDYDAETLYRQWIAMAALALFDAFLQWWTYGERAAKYLVGVINHPVTQTLRRKVEDLERENERLKDSLTLSPFRRAEYDTNADGSLKYKSDTRPAATSIPGSGDRVSG